MTCISRKFDNYLAQKNTKNNTVPQKRILDYDYVNPLCGAVPDLNKFVPFYSLDTSCRGG
jgi:hypothetical protein